jgi:protein-S-isoprenylcysteine O-methyltransferase Ste14
MTPGSKGYRLLEQRAPMSQAPPEEKREERGARVRFPPPLVFVGYSLLGVLLHRAVTPLPFPLGRWITLIAGVLVLAAGLGLIAAALRLHRRSGQDPKPWKPTPSLLFEGPYRFTRNPMYLGLTLLEIALGLMLDNLWISLLAFLGLLTVHFIAVKPEEEYLTEKFGDSYRAYLAKVRRYL